MENFNRGLLLIVGASTTTGLAVGLTEGKHQKLLSINGPI